MITPTEFEVIIEALKRYANEFKGNDKILDDFKELIEKIEIMRDYCQAKEGLED